jgi:hypothetical protein
MPPTQAFAATLQQSEPLLQHAPVPPQHCAQIGLWQLGSRISHRCIGPHRAAFSPHTRGRAGPGHGLTSVSKPLASGVLASAESTGTGESSGDSTSASGARSGEAGAGASCKASFSVASSVSPRVDDEAVSPAPSAGLDNLPPHPAPKAKIKQKRPVRIAPFPQKLDATLLDQQAEGRSSRVARDLATHLSNKRRIVPLARIRERGSETGFHKGRRITRDANILAGFENPDPDGTRHAVARSKTATGTWWAMRSARLWFGRRTRPGVVSGTDRGLAPASTAFSQFRYPGPR